MKRGDFDRHHARHFHDASLILAQAKHVPDDAAAATCEQSLSGLSGQCNDRAPLPPPTKQAHRTEAGGEEWECGWKRSSRKAVYSARCL